MIVNLLTSILLGLISCLIFRKVSKYFNLVDVPDGVRKTHKGLIPLGGGLAIAFTFILSVLIYVEVNHFFLVLSLCSLILLFVGLVDDFLALPISVRLITQILVSWCVIIFTDVYIKDLGDLLGLGNIYLGQLGIPLTIFMVVGVCNAFNMLDGMDGLVSMISLMALICLTTILYFNEFNYSWSIALIGGVTTFFLFNLGLFGKKFQIFLGDSGAMPLGFFLAWVLVSFSQQPTKAIEPVSAIWVILIPLIDALSVFYRRLRLGKGIFLGDRNHIHYILLDGGVTKSAALLILFLISLIGCLVVLYFSFFPTQPSYLFYGFLTLWVFYLLLTKASLRK